MTKHRIKVKLLWNALIDDIERKAYRLARLTKLGVELSSSNEPNSLGQKLESEISLSDDDNNILRRAMREALADITVLCKEFIYTKDHKSDNLIIAEDDITLTLMMPNNYNLAGNISLGTVMQAYIVAKTLATWFTYTAISDKQLNALKKQEAIAAEQRRALYDIIYSRIPSRRDGQSLTIIVGEDTYSVKVSTTTTLGELKITLFKDGQESFADVNSVVVSCVGSSPETINTFNSATITKTFGNQSYSKEYTVTVVWNDGTSKTVKGLLVPKRASLESGGLAPMA